MAVASFIAADWHITEGRNGLMVTSPALLAGVSALAAKAFAGNVNRSRIRHSGRIALAIDNRTLSIVSYSAAINP